MHVTDRDRGNHVTDDWQPRLTAEPVRTSADGLVRRAWGQDSVAGGSLTEQGARVSEYITETYPAGAILVAGAIGYGVAYLTHAGRQPPREPLQDAPRNLGEPNRIRRDRVPHRGEVVGRDVPDESKERHTDIAV